MLSMILRSSTSSLNSPGCSGSALLSSLVAKSMRPVGIQSCFTTPLESWLLLPLARLVITVSGFAIARSLTFFQTSKGISERSTSCDHYAAPVQNFLPSDVVADFIVACVVAHADKLPPIRTVAGVPITTVEVAGVAIVIAGVATVVAIATVAGVVATVVAIATVTVVATEHVSLL